MTNKPIKVMSIFGTRPEAIKMAPVVQCFARDTRFEQRIAVTGQHREMLDQALGAFGITPDYDLNVMEQGQRLADLTARCVQGLDSILEMERPDMVLVHGDTTTALAAGLAAYYHQIPVGHVEAGLRTDRCYEPFPEEMNRRLLGSLASLHFAPTPRAKVNLLREGVDAQTIYVTGNTVIDALLSQVDADYIFDEPDLQAIDWTKRLLLVTMHRRENVGEPMKGVYRALLGIVEKLPDVEVIFSLHKNPAVREPAREALSGCKRIHLIEPPSYRTFVNLMARAALIVSDSGGIQEEAPALGRPVLLLREVTERPEGVEAGACVVVGTDAREIERTAVKLLSDSQAYEAMAQASNPYGDGQGARRIVKAIAFTFGLEGEPPEEFNAKEAEESD